MLFILFITLFSMLHANAQSLEAWYHEQNYESIITHYQKNLPVYGSEWLMLGNAYAENNQPAHAIAAWRKAQRINNCISFYAEKNINLLKKKLHIKKTKFETVFFAISYILGRIPLIIVQILFLFLCWLFVLLRRYRWYTAPLLLIMTIYLYTIYTFSFSGVILHDTLIHVGPHTNYEPQEQISALQEVTILRTVNTWYHIQYDKQKYGWVKNDSLITYQNM